jgi:hypothetical protein
MYLLLTFFLSSFSTVDSHVQRAEKKIIYRTVTYDTSKVLTLIKNGVDGLSKEYPEKKVIIEFSASQDTTLIYANILVDAELVFIYTIETKGYSIVRYKDLRKEKKDEISSE